MEPAINPDAGLIIPDWPAPAGVIACCTTRVGGVSEAPFDSFNLAAHVNDDPAAVAANRDLLSRHLGLAQPIAWLDQVHGADVVPAGEGADGAVADAVWTDQPGLACAVLTADCLPLLLCDDRGTCVAAVHAGWRGLAHGVVEAAVAALPAVPETLLVWLGPAIGPAAFEVGAEVRDAFLAGPGGEGLEGCFAPSPGRDGHFLADLYTLARLRLAACGVTRVYGGGACTYSENDRYFSYRREGDTGRMASLVLLRPAA